MGRSLFTPTPCLNLEYLELFLRPNYTKVTSIQNVGHQ
jgi:hypothetical protein